MVKKKSLIIILEETKKLSYKVNIYKLIDLSLYDIF